MYGCAVDISEEAVALTRENATRTGLSERLTVILSSIETLHTSPHLHNSPHSHTSPHLHNSPHSHRSPHSHNTHHSHSSPHPPITTGHGCLWADVIVSNPPYITTSDMATLDHSVSWYEDKRALHGGKDGLDVAAKILEFSSHHLKQGGELWLELGLNQDPTILLTADSANHLSHVSSYNDFTQRLKSFESLEFQLSYIYSTFQTYRHVYLSINYM
ncbi:Release factor glutamine methyltransferase [Geodia barretti]|uniref:Release factor glutamine methyltransferase n=1 Tax=Geodia barretti TaxID=519541 RepID=A0AA35RQV3_GEOBA|nr:Release factor glutamine methyltransferase [Geodia barretti]